MDQLIKTLPAILKAAGASEEVSQAACIAVWKHAVGEGLSVHAVPIQLLNRTLVVVVADNIWKRQLESMRGQLLFRLNSLLGQPLVASIELRVDPGTLNTVRGTVADANKDRDNNYPLPEELLLAATEIEDARLRRAFLGAAASCVRRQDESKS